MAFQKAGQFDLAGAQMTMFPDGLGLDVIPFAILEDAFGGTKAWRNRSRRIRRKTDVR